MRKTYKGKITSLPENGIFVFGSNTQGRHGLGSAKTAREQFGAIYGQASGLQGQSYAIVTKDLTKSKHPSIPNSVIKMQITHLYMEAQNNPDKEYYIAYSGEGKNLNSYSPEEMAAMFAEVDGLQDNIIFEEKFWKLVQKRLIENIIEEDENDGLYQQPNKYAQCLLSIYDTLKLYDTGNLYTEQETLSQIMWRKMKAYNIDLNEELGFTHLKPVSKKGGLE